MDKKGRRFASDTDDATKVVDLHQDKAQDEKKKEADQRLKEKNDKKLKKLMKKKQRREKHSERDRRVLSYEDMPLEEREEKKPSGFRLNKKRVILAAIIVLVLFVAVFLFANSDRFSIHNISNFIRYGVLNQDSNESFPIDIPGENISAGNFQRIGQDLCYASDTKLQMVNNYGRLMYSAQHGFSSPVLVSSSNYSLVYNLGGTGYIVSSLEKQLISQSADKEIHVAAIAENGTYALVTESDGYLSQLEVYDKDQTKIFGYSFADYYITSVSLNSSGRQAVLSGVSALNGTSISALYVLDFTKDSPLHMVELEDMILYEVSYLNDGNACAIGNNACMVINTRSGKVESTPYEGKTLSAYDINTDTDTYTVSLSRSGDGRNCEINSYNTNGTLSRSFVTDISVIDLSTYKNRVALLSTDKIYLYGKDGTKVGDKAVGIDTHAVVLYTSSDAYLLSTSEINSVSM